MPTAKADYPTKLVRLIEPFGPGSGPEVVATAVGRKLAELWGQPVTVENHPGAGSTAAPAMVATYQGACLQAFERPGDSNL